MNFWNPDKVVANIQNQIAVFESQMNSNNQEEIKELLNRFSSTCIANVSDEDSLVQSKLLLCRMYVNYSTQYQCLETTKNVIEQLQELKSNSTAFFKHIFNSKSTLGHALFNYFQFENGKILANKSDLAFEYLNEAKNYFFQLYSFHFQKKLILSPARLNITLKSLAACFINLNRYFESIHYLYLLDKLDPNDEEVNYLLAKALEELKENTCIDYNSLLLLKIIDTSRKGQKSIRSFKDERIGDLKNLEDNTKSVLQKHNISIRNLRKHYKEFEINKSIKNDQLAFTDNLNLYLTEHNLYCNCKKGLLDDIVIESEHEHTKTKKVRNLQEYLENIKSDFKLARKLYYESSKETPLINYHLRTKKQREYQKISCLKNSFKTCYTILDNLSYLILKALDIKPPKEYLNQITFLDIWRLDLIDQERMNTNIYIRSLHSISMDMKKDRKAALSEFKEIRNQLEHRLLKITYRDKVDNIGLSIISFDSLFEYNKTLMLITKSAILTFVNLVRRESKIREYSSI